MNKTQHPGHLRTCHRRFSPSDAAEAVNLYSCTLVEVDEPLEALRASILLATSTTPEHFEQARAEEHRLAP